MGRTNPFLQFGILFYRPTPLPAMNGIAGLLLVQQAGHAGLVGTSSRSLASPLAGKLDPFTVPLLPSRHCDSRVEAARQSRRSFFPACFLRHWRRFSGKLSPRDPRQSRWARAGIPTKELPGTKVLFIQQAGHAGQLLALQELQGGASQQSSALPGTH